MSDLPPVTQEPVIYVDATPDDGYPLRILRAYRENCNVRWSDNTSGEQPMNPLLVSMNEHQERRAKILDAAILILEMADGRCPAVCDKEKKKIDGEWLDALTTLCESLSDQGEADKLLKNITEIIEAANQRKKLAIEKIRELIPGL